MKFSMEHIITTFETNQIITDFLYLDFTLPIDNQIDNNIMSRELPNNTQTFSIKENVKKVELTEREDDDFNDIDYICKYLSENLKEIPIKHPKHQDRSLFSFTVNDYNDNEDLSYRLLLKLKQTSYQIAAEGRIGHANIMFMNENTLKKWILEMDLSQFNNIKIFVNEQFTDNEICLMNNTDITKPGYKYVYYIDENKEKYYSDVIQMGMFSDNQAVKFKIYE